MEYTKDIILDINYKKREILHKLNNLKVKVKYQFKYTKERTISIYKNNKFIISILLILIVLISVDIILLNGFFNILENIK